MRQDLDSPHIATSARRLLVALTLALSLFAVACGSEQESASSIASVDDLQTEPASDNAVQAADSETTDDPPVEPESDAATEQTDEELALEFTACMRNEGIEMDDPSVNADGSIDLFGGGGGEPGGGRETFGDGFEDAFEACGDVLDEATFLGERLDRTETEDQFLNFAQCLRDQGLEVDDPDFNDLGPGAEGGGLFGDFDPQDPANADAVDACRDEMSFGAGDN